MISICMITYNHEFYIESAIRGVLAQQTNFDIELLISNDNSNDQTHQKILSLTKNLPRNITLSYFNQEKNLGMMSNFIFALEHCKGKYIALLDGDDYWTDPLKLQKQVDFLEENLDYNICFHNMQIKDESKNLLLEDTITREVENSTTSVDLAKGNFIHTPSVVLRNNFTIPDWFHQSPIGDWVLYMLAIKDKKIKKIEEVLGVYRSHGSSVWSLKTEKYRLEKTLNAYELVFHYNQYDSLTTNVLEEKINYFKKSLNKNSLEQKKSIIQRIAKKLFK